MRNLITSTIIVIGLLFTSILLGAGFTLGAVAMWGYLGGVHP